MSTHETLIEIQDDGAAPASVAATGPRGGRWRSAWRLASSVLGVLMIVALAAFAWQRRDLLADADVLSAPRLAICALATILGWQFTSSLTSTLMLAHGCRLPLREQYLSICAGNAGNYLPMRIGTICRAVYVKTCFGMPFAEFFSVMLAQAIVGGAVAAAVLLGAFAAGSRMAGDETGRTLAVAAVMTLSPVGLLLLPGLFDALRRNVRLPSLVSRVLASIVVLGRSPRTLLAASLWHFLSVVCAAVRLWMIYGAFGAPVSVWATIFVTAAGALSMLIAPTPGALGVREASMAAAGAVFGVNFELSLLVASLERAILLALTMLIGAPALVWMNREVASRVAGPLPSSTTVAIPEPN
ncbi:MAG: flippase-like domain-containing protein [Planctomyces sp.]|nr:flippase-like domain-containing protein [Planctomyces sp.]